jgi:hypothetical protein
MFNHLTNRLVLGGLIAVVATFAMVDTADAQTRRLRFDPAYGTPFNTLGNELGWQGYADVSYGTCDGPGPVTNLPSSCNGALSFIGATVELYNTSNVSNILQTINFVGGQVAQMTFDSSNELTSVYSSPFNPVVGGINETKYNGTDQAYFSLIFVGEFAQLMWFDKNPGNALLNPLVFPYVKLPNALVYAGCYFLGQGNKDPKLDGCGISSNLDGAGAKLTITPVPEPETYALMLAGLGAILLMSRRRRELMR